MWQSLVVAGLVAGCGIYAAWTLSPKKLRSRLAQALLRLQPTRWLKDTLTRAANAQGGCGCSGCDRSPLGAGLEKQRALDIQGASEFKPVTVIRRNGRSKNFN